MITRDDIFHRREEIIALARRHRASNVRLFGSVARGDARATSDVDLIVHFEPGASLLDHGGLVMDLRELLGVDIDIVDDEGMRERFRQSVMKDAVAV